ncbi:MAG: alkene reductase [Pseudomonadota bacterium]
MSALFNSHKVGKIDLQHRIVLAPMSRYRSTRRMAPPPITAEYYAQRATPGGLLITEATHINPEGTPVWNIYPAIRDHGGESPGIWTAEQTEAHRVVVEAVHARGAYISCQLQHCGRVAQDDMKHHQLVKESGLPVGPVSSSAVSITPSADKGDNYSWDQPSSPPRALSESGIARVIKDYAHAARNAVAAGFDCVELHAGHGYLISQFLCDSVNQRTDRYGGSINNRCRLLFDVVAALIEAVGPFRVGVRLSPTFKAHIQYFDVWDSDPLALYSAAIDGLNDYPLAYLLLTEPRAGGLASPADCDPAFTQPLSSARFRNLYRGTLMAAGGFTPTSAARAVENGDYDLVAFGRWFLSNPDLPNRIRKGSPLNVYDRATFYSNGIEGYTDYPDEEGGMGEPGKYPQMNQDKIGTSLAHP